MKYRKASDVLPDKLLKEVQKYVDSEALYFPKYKQRKTWLFYISRLPTGKNDGRRKK